MNRAKNLIEAVAGGVSPIKVVNEFLDDRDAVDAIMLVIRNERKLYDGLMKGTMQPKQAAKEGSDLYLKALTETLKDFVMNDSVQKELQRQVASWISTVKAGK